MKLFPDDDDGNLITGLWYALPIGAVAWLMIIGMIVCLVRY
ncbi:hypothetical protein [Paenibacillus alkalitolerans]|nr:hypothetical protein [Paenibacillus alkalitolerans]